MWGWEIEICTYILHRGTHHVISRMRNDNSALCLWAHEVWGRISQKPLEIETWFQRTTNRKWPMPSRMVTWPMTSRDSERSRSWPQYVWCPLSRKWLEIEAWFQRIANRYIGMAYGESNGHVLDDVMCLVFWFGTDYILSRHFQKRKNCLEI